jgi:hypothetical protein
MSDPSLAWRRAWTSPRNDLGRPVHASFAEAFGDADVVGVDGPCSHVLFREPEATA